MSATMETAPERTRADAFLNELVEVLARRYRVMLLAVAIVLAGGVFLARTRPKLYRASARVLIEPRRPGLPAADKDYGLAMYYVFYRNELQTQLLLIKSRLVAERVAEKLGLRDRGPSTRSAVPGARPEPVEGSGPRGDGRPPDTDGGTPAGGVPGGASRGSNGPAARADAAESGTAPAPEAAGLPRATPSAAPEEEGAPPFPVDPEDPAKALLALYEAEPVGETRFIEISARATDPRWAARIANAVAQAYIEEMIDHRNRLLRETMEAYTLRSPEQHEKLERAERDLIRFQEEHLIVSSDKPEETLRQQELELVAQLASARRERIGVQARLMAHSADGELGRPGDDLGRAAAADDAWVRQLLDARLTQRALITGLSKSFSEGHPKLESAKTSLAEIERELADAAKSYYERMQLAHQSATWKEQEIARLLKEHRKEIVRLRTQLARLENLRQRRDSLRALLGPVARSQAELELAASLNLPNVSVVEPASAPVHPSEPNLPKYVLGALLVGLILGSGLVVVLESLDDSVRTLDDVARAAPVKVLGTVSVIRRHVARDERGRALVTADRSDSAVAEQFRSLRTGILEFAGQSGNGRPRDGAAGEAGRPPGARLSSPKSGEPPGTVALVTSPDLADGKTTVSLNVAEAFAQLGQPVIIVDADLRRPKGHEFLGVPRSPGLVEVLEGEAELADAVSRTPVADLCFLPAGRKTSRPAELIASERLGEVLSELRRTYSSVWLDTAPVVPVADARVLASASDFAILVVRSARTKRRALARSYELLAGAGGERGDGRLVGAVLNGVVPSVEKQYGYYGRAYERYYGGKET